MRLNGPILWSSRKLTVVADSSAEAEIAQGSRCTKDMVFARTVLAGVKRPVLGLSTTIVDNSAMYDLVNKEGSSSRTRYFERATVLIKYAVMRLMVTLHLVSTKHMIADIFTKATEKETFERMRDYIMNVSNARSSRKGRDRIQQAADLIGRLVSSI